MKLLSGMVPIGTRVKCDPCMVDYPFVEQNPYGVVVGHQHTSEYGLDHVVQFDNGETLPIGLREFEIAGPEPIDPWIELRSAAQRVADAYEHAPADEIRKAIDALHKALENVTGTP